MSGFIASASMADIHRLETIIESLSQRIAELEHHGHSYAACYGPGGEWDKTTGPVEAKQVAADGKGGAGMKYINDAAELGQVPQLSVVQFRGEALKPNHNVVWQLDEAWFPAGGTSYVYSEDFPTEAFPAVVLWSPEASA